jgi:transposase
MLGAFDPIRRQLRVRTSATKRSADFIALLDDLGIAYGQSKHTRPLVVVMDNGPIHTSKLTTQALAARPWLTVEWLPKYAPELNAIERCWRDLKQHHLANHTFTDANDLDRTIHRAIDRLNQERQPHPSANFLKAA